MLDIIIDFFILKNLFTINYIDNYYRYKKNSLNLSKMDLYNTHMIKI